MPASPLRIIPIWKTAPFLRLIVPLIGGILLGRYILPGWSYWSIALVIAALCWTWAYFNALRFPLLFGTSVFLFWITTGAYLFNQTRVENKPTFISSKYANGSILLATLTTPPEKKPNSFRAEANIRQWDTVGKKWTDLSGRIIIYFARDSFPQHMQMGSRIILAKTLQPIRSSGNPGGFDYKNYAALNGWFYQVYLKQGEFILKEKAHIPWWRIWPIKARDHLLATLRKYIPDPKTLGVAEALLTGYRNDMDKELAWQYAGTGVAHIIAISGLHLGMIQVGLLLLLTPIARLPNGSKIRALMVIICLWIFAFITGAGPSVLRSALMFSMLLFGDLIGRKGNPYNTLAASAFLLLLVQPALIFHVGFQLSYSAVLSLFMFSKHIGRWVHTQYRWINKGWQMLSVTLAAQILTLPFVVYYFKMFPVYFLLANLVAIPLSSLALYFSLALTILFSWLHPIATILGQATDVTIFAMNWFIAWIHHLPYARIENIHLSIYEAIWLMIVIGFFAAWLLLRNKNSAVIALGCLLLFLLSREINWRKNDSQKILIIYNIARHTAIDLINGHWTTYFGDPECIADDMLYRMNLQPARIQYQITEMQYLPKDSSLFQRLKVNGLNILVIDKDMDTRKSGTITTDILLIATNLRARPEWVLEKIKCREIVAGANLPYYRVKQWQIAADSLHLRFHSLTDKGAYVLDLNSPDPLK